MEKARVEEGHRKARAKKAPGRVCVSSAQAPQRVVPGARMPYAGLHNPQQAAALVTYLSTLH